MNDIQNKLKKVGKNIFKKIGIDIKYVHEGVDDLNHYEIVLESAISVKKPLNIVQVGANGGKYNDPIYGFNKTNKNSTNVILVEPLKIVIPHLEENYSYHPSHEIFNKAVSSKDIDTIELYQIKEEHHENINVSYGDNWPNYRVATGVTTSDKERLIQWASENVYTKSPIEEVVERIEIEVIQPREILDQSRVATEVDVLQVDAEGMDDTVVYSFFDDEISPKIINIEDKHLDDNQKNNYLNKMSEKGYRTYKFSNDDLLSINTNDMN